MKKKEGISLISLIITIIVIIILAAIVIFSGMGTPEKAQLASFATDLDNVESAVLQAYADKRIEIGVNGEVWTSAQIYESIATGEDNRDNLVGGAFAKIDEENGKVNMTLPKYETRGWYIALEDSGENIRVGDVALLPGFENGGKIYITKGDLQHGGRDENVVAPGEGVVTPPAEIPEEEKLVTNLKVGDYVEYTPDSNTYTTDTNNTGYTSAQTLTTGTNAWRVLYVDESTGEVLITTEGIVNDGIYLRGTKGCLRGPQELNNICKNLYSNSSLGLTARSMTVEDLNKACNYTPSEPTTRYAYYPKGTTFPEGDTTIEYNGKTYRKTAHGYTEYTTAEFYTSDGGGTEKTDGDGFTYRTPEAGNPVYVTKTYYGYNPSSKNSTVGSILGSNYGWLASPSVAVDSDYAYFFVRNAYSSSVDANGLYYSRGEEPLYSSSGNGVSPLVSLSSTLRVDISDTSRDGSTAAKAWKIIK